MKQNLAVSLEKEVVRKGRVLAAMQGTSLSRLVSDKLPEAIREKEAYPMVKKKALAQLKKKGSTSVKLLVDTDILIYAHDLDAGRKQATAAALRKNLWEEEKGVLSTQAIQEFYVIITRKIPRPLTPAGNRRSLNPFEGPCWISAVRYRLWREKSRWTSSWFGRPSAGPGPNGFIKNSQWNKWICSREHWQPPPIKASYQKIFRPAIFPPPN